MPFHQEPQSPPINPYIALIPLIINTIFIITLTYIHASKNMIIVTFILYTSQLIAFTAYTFVSLRNLSTKGVAKET